MQTIKALLGSEFKIVPEIAEGQMELTDAQMEMLNGGEAIEEVVTEFTPIEE